jgi:hypothetical protein
MLVALYVLEETWVPKSVGPTSGIYSFEFKVLQGLGANEEKTIRVISHKDKYTINVNGEDFYGVQESREFKVGRVILNRLPNDRLEVSVGQEFVDIVALTKEDKRYPTNKNLNGLPIRYEEFDLDGDIVYDYTYYSKNYGVWSTVEKKTTKYPKLFMDVATSFKEL